LSIYEWPFIQWDPFGWRVSSNPWGRAWAHESKGRKGVSEYMGLEPLEYYERLATDR